jgi:hypothetical protein
MRVRKQSNRVFDDREGYYRLLQKLAERETPPGEKPNVSVIIRRFLREGLERAGLLRVRKSKIANRKSAIVPGGEL